jgi:hypothetical protein
MQRGDLQREACMAGAGAAAVAALTAGLLTGLPGERGTHHSTRVTARTAAYALKRAAAQAVTQSGQPAPARAVHPRHVSGILSMTDGGGKTTWLTVERRRYRRQHNRPRPVGTALICAAVSTAVYH